jgi:prepilin-type N-terminal cleavage/methylation domain-containing protein
MKDIKQTSLRVVSFTLTELLVVIAILAILLSLLFPSLLNTIYHTQITSCAFTQKNIVVGMQVYADDFLDAYPKGPNYRGKMEALSRYKGNDSIRDIIKPYFGLLEKDFRCTGIANNYKSKDLDNAKSWDNLGTDFYMFFNCFQSSNNGWGAIGVYKDQQKVANPNLQMTHIGKTWSPMYTGHHTDTTVPAFSLFAADMKGNHIAPSFSPTESTHWSNKGKWTGGPSEYNYSFEDGHTELVPAYHDEKQLKLRYIGFPIALLEKWVVEEKPKQ